MPTTSGLSQQPQPTIKPPTPGSRVQTLRRHLTTMPIKCTRGIQDCLAITIIDKNKEEKENTYFLA
jgi:hypothetical protein